MSFRADSRHHGHMAANGEDPVRLRRVADGPPTLRSAYRQQRRYEIHQPDGRHQVLSLRKLDALLNGRACPADFWACVHTSDEAFARGDHEALIEWPL